MRVFVTIINPAVRLFSNKKKLYEANNLIENECIIDIVTVVIMVEDNQAKHNRAPPHALASINLDYTFVGILIGYCF